jgi:hypothetical protein
VKEVCLISLPFFIANIIVSIKQKELGIV